MNRSYLLDKDFLKQLDSYNNRIIYARIISLDYDEQPIEQIEGVVTAGNISIDGKSAVRRTCSLTVMTDRLDINDIYWGFRSKIKLEIGLENIINKDYPDIIWFPQGIYILNNFSTQQNVNNYTVNLSGKDKMCLLNGDIGGVFNAETNFSVIDEVTYDNNGNAIVQHIDQPIKSIILEMIHHYAQEPFSNIIIKDLDKSALNMLDNHSGHIAYILRKINEDTNAKTYSSIIWDGYSDEQINYYLDKDKTQSIYTENVINFGDNFIFETLVNEDDLWNVVPLNPDYIYDDYQNKYTVIKIEPGAAIGYQTTELIYPKEKELIASVGSTVTSILDAIVNFLGEYEYFYNLEGQFIFQAKPIYVNTSWNSIQTYSNDGDDWVAPSTLVSKVEYGFEGSNIVTALSNQPKINNIKNDYTVWGEKEFNGITIPIHSRYAIDDKPYIYVSFPREEQGPNVYISNNDVEELGNEIINKLNMQYSNCMLLKRDWRELIYQMAIDYLKHNHDEDFEYELRRLNTLPNGISLFPKGKTGYEQYYHDLQGFWRLLYNPEAEPLEENGEIIDYTYAMNGDDSLSQSYNHDETTNNYWNKNVHTYPHNLLFWFDFFQGEGINKFSVHTIGSRPKAINETSVKSIIYQDVPDILFFNNKSEKEAYENAPDSLTGYDYMLADVSQIAQISTRGIAAHDKIDNMLFENTYYNSSVSITSLPVYYLEPNGICYVKNEKSKIDGYYIMEKITIPLTYNGTMAVNAIELPQRIY